MSAAVAFEDSGTAIGARPRGRTSSWATPHPAVLALIALAGAWIVTFAVLVVRRHHGFYDLAFDMGIHDQSVWLLAHGHDFLTVRGLPVFGHHASLAYYLLVPAYWLGAGPDFLNLVQVVALGTAVIPLYLLARDRSLPPWMAGALAAVFLLHPATQFFAWELFHPEVVAITPLLCACLCATRHSWRWFTFWAVFAVAWKEDVALAVVVLGLLVALREHRRIGLVTAGAALGWFLLWTMLLFPEINGGAVQAEGIYQGVGGSPTGMFEKLFSDPGAITSHLFSSESGDFAYRLLLPFGFIPLLAPLVVLIGLPQFLLDVLTDVPWTRVIQHHYAALCVAALALANVHALAWLWRRSRPQVAIGVCCVVVAGGVFGTLAWGPSPLSSEYRAGWWPPADDPRIDSLDAAVDLIPDDATVTATYGILPQLSQRAEIYDFPNPWESRNFGIEGKPTRSPRRVEWLIVDRSVVRMDPAAAALLETILDDFNVVFERDDVLVARRRGST